MHKSLSISFMAVVMILVTPLTILACQWLEKTNSETAPVISQVSESGWSADKMLTDRVMNSDISRGAILDRDSGVDIQNKIYNDIGE